MQNVKIPAQHYVGLSNRSDKIPMGFMVPAGTDAAAKKRQATVDRWVGYSKRGDKKGLEAVTIDNVPMLGFRLTADIRTSDYGSADKWRIEDPRGFELEISAGNLAQLLSVGVLDKGEIQDECVWARHGQNNVLLSIETEEYKSAVENTRVANKATSWKDAQIGNEVTLQNGVKGIWFGKVYAVGIKDVYYGYGGDTNYVPGRNKLQVSDKNFGLMYVVEEGARNERKLYLVRSQKLSEITGTDTMTQQEAEEKLAALIADSGVSADNSSLSSVLFYTYDKSPSIALSLEKADIDDAAEALELAKASYGKRWGGSDNVWAELTDGRLGKLTATHSRKDLYMFDRQLLDSNVLADITKLVDNSGGYYYRRSVHGPSRAHECFEFDIQAQGLVKNYSFINCTISSKSGAVLTAKL